jgi:hypothetical protein
MKWLGMAGGSPLPLYL